MIKGLLFLIYLIILLLVVLHLGVDLFTTVLIDHIFILLFLFLKTKTILLICYSYLFFTEVSLSHWTASKRVWWLLGSIKVLLSSKFRVGGFLTLIILFNLIVFMLETRWRICIALTIFIEWDSVWFWSLYNLFLLPLRC